MFILPQQIWHLFFSEIFFFAVQDMLTVTRNEEKKLEKQNPHRGRAFCIFIRVSLCADYRHFKFLIFFVTLLLIHVVLLPLDSLIVDQIHERRETINSSVNTDIEKIFRGKTSAQLAALRSQINQKISGGGTVDIGTLEQLYQSLGKKICIRVAKSRLRACGHCS